MNASSLKSSQERRNRVFALLLFASVHLSVPYALYEVSFENTTTAFFAPLLSEGDKKCSPRVDYDNSYANYSHTALFLQARGFDQVTPTLAQPDYSLKLHRAPTRALAHLIWCFSAVLQAVEGENSVSNESCYAVCPMWHTAGVPTIFAPVE